MTVDRLITPREAIEYLALDQQGLKMPRESLRWLCRTGRIRYVKVGRYVRFRQQWLDDYIENQCFEPRGPATRSRPGSRPA